MTPRIVSPTCIDSGPRIHPQITALQLSSIQKLEAEMCKILKNENRMEETLQA
jgi:hypothetical protein